MFSLKERLCTLFLGLFGVYGSGFVLYYFDFLENFPIWFGFPTFIFVGCFYIFSFLLIMFSVFAGWVSTGETNDDDFYEG